MRDYYAFTGPFAERIAAGYLTSARAIKDLIRGYADEGCDELMLLPTVADLDELERLAEADMRVASSAPGRLGCTSRCC